MTNQMSTNRRYSVRKKILITSFYNLMEKLEHIPVNLDLEEIKRRLRTGKSGDWSQVQTLVEEAQSLISAKAVYKVCYIESKQEGAITINGRRLKSRVLRKNLNTVERVFPYVVTIGNRLEEKTRACTDLLKKYYLDTIGNVALTATQKYLEDQLRSRYALDGMSCMSLCIVSEERKEFFKECQIFFPGKHRDALFRIVGFLFLK